MLYRVQESLAHLQYTEAMLGVYIDAPASAALKTPTNQAVVILVLTQPVIRKHLLESSVGQYLLHMSPTTCEL